MNSEYWIPIKDGDPRAVALYNRHYSARKGLYKIDRVKSGFSGVGESLILMTQDCRALFGWRKSKYHDDGQLGILCFIFRNEGDTLSSTLIKEADDWAWNKWLDDRLYTYVNPDKINHKRDPGRCFIKAGWKKCGVSPAGLVILDIIRNRG